MTEKKTSAAQLRAAQKYKREKVKRITVDFSPTEADLWEHLQAQGKKQTYIKNLIRADARKKNIIYGADGTVYVQDEDKQGWTGETKKGEGL